MEGLIPWQQLEDRIDMRGWPWPPPLSAWGMLRVQAVLQRERMEDLLYEVESVRRFVSDGRDDLATCDDLGMGLFEEINVHLGSGG